MGNDFKHYKSLETMEIGLLGYYQISVWQVKELCRLITKNAYKKYPFSG